MPTGRAFSAEQGGLDTKRFGGQGSGGSDSITSEGEQMRKAGATARALLVAGRGATLECAAGRMHHGAQRGLSRRHRAADRRTATSRPMPRN